jgi:hypothetical protein
MAPRLKPPAAKAPASTGPPPWLNSGTNAGTAADQQPAAGTAAKAAEKAGLVAPGEVDTEITGEDLKNSIKAIVPEMRGMILSTPKSMGNFLGSFVGLGLGQPAEWAKKGGVGWAQNIPLAGFVFSKAGAEWAKSLEATAKDIWYAKTGNNDFPQYDPKTKSISYNSNEKTDRITQALRNGESPAGVLIEDFANISLIGSIFKRGFGGAAAVSEAKGAQAAGKAQAAATPEEAAAFTEKAAGYTEKAQKARERQKAAATFERSTGLVGAAPIMAYTIPIKGATRLAGTAGRSFADRFREQANRLERAGDQTGRAGWYRRRADDLNRFAGTPMRDANGNAVIDPNTGKPQIVQRGAVSQWAKDRLRRVEAKKQQIVRQGLNMLMKPYAFDEVNPETGKAYGPLSPIEQEAVFAVRNGRSRLLVTLQQALPELNLETIVQFGSRSRDEGFSLSDDGARLAVAFETQGLNPTQTRRIAEAVGALDYYIETNLAGPRREGYGTAWRDPDTGELKRDPLDPYLDMPVPRMEGLQQALRRSAETQDLADIFDRLIEQDLSNRAVDDPVRINMIAAIAEATPTEVLAPYLSDGTLDLSIWPAKERNRIAEVMAIREALGQRGVEEVIGTPPPKDGPGGAPRPLQEDPTTGLPTVEDIVAQKFPGQLPRSSARYMMNSIKALGKLRGRARALAQQMYDSQIAIDAAERHIVEMHLQLMELEGFWLNRLGRRVEPNKKGELPKSARRIEGLVAEAKAIRDEQLALYNDMVAKQQESIVIEGVSVGRDVIASNVENLSRAIDDAEAKVEAIEQTAGELAQLAEQLADHDARAAALLELEGADPQALRAVIDADLQNMPADLSDLPTLGKEFAGADEIVANGVTGLESINRRMEVISAERDRLQKEYDAELEQFDEGMDYDEYQAAVMQIDEQYGPRIDAVEAQMEQLFDVQEAFITQLTDKLSDYISALDPIRAVELSDRLKTVIDVSIARERDARSMLRREEFDAVRAELTASIKLQEIYAEQLVPLVSSLQAALASPSDPVSWPGQTFNEPAAPGAGGRTLPVPRGESVRVTHRGVLYELRITEGKWDSKKYYYPGVVQLVRILDNVDESMARYKESTGVDTDVAPFASPVPGFSLKTGQRTNEIVLDEAGIAKIEAAIRKDADELAKNKKYKSVDVRPTMQRAEEAFVAVDEAGSLKKELDDIGDFVDFRGVNDMVKAVKAALSRTQKLAASGKARSKNSKLRNDIYPLERNIAALDAAIENYDRTGNWMGRSYGITGIEGLNVNYLVNLGGGPDGNRLRQPVLSAEKGVSTDAFNIESIREAAMSVREGLAAQLEERLSNLTPDELAEVAKDAGKQTKAAASTDPPKTNALNAKSWTKMQDGSLQFDTGTRTYEVRTVERPGPAGKKKLNDFVLKRVGSDGLPIESTTRVFKTFASARKYVAETVSIDGNMAAAYSGPKATLELEPPKTPPFPKDLIDAEARLAKLEGRRVSLLKGLNREEAKLTKLRIRDAKTRALQPRVAAAEARLEARLGREIITQPEVTQVGGKEIPVNQEFGVRLRPTETQRRMRQPDGQPLSDEVRATYEAVEASLNEANMRRRERVPVTIAMRSSMSLPREQVPTGQQVPGRFRDVVDVYGARYVPATGRSTGEPGPARVFVEGLTGRRKLSSQKFRTGNYEEIYNMRTLIERVVAENRQMNQNEAIVALMSSQFAVTAEELLGPELIEKFDRDAFRYVASSASEGGIDAYQPGRLDRDAFFKKQYAQRRGQLIREEMARRGWETNPGEYTNIEAARPDRHINATTRFLPKYVRTAVIRKTAFVDPSAFNVYLKNVQRGTTLFKNLTLPLSITWQLGDIISTFLLSALTGIPTDQLIRNMKVAYEQNYGGGIREMFKGEADRTIGSVGEFISESGLQDVGLRLEERAALKGIEPTKIGSLPSRIPVVGAVPRAYGWFRERAYRFNEFTNRLGRQAYFMSRLENSLKEYNAAQRQLDSNHIDVTMERIADFRLHETNAEIGRLFWDTINQANDVMGDWLDLAPWERRYVMPHITFYAWVKHINKLFFKLAMNDPTKIMWYMYLGQLAYEPDTDPFGILAGYVPSFAKGFLSRLDFAGPFSDVASGVPWNIFEQFASGNASEATLEPAAALFSPAPRLMAAAVGKSLKGGITDLGRPPGTGAITQSGREVSPSLLSPARFGELVGATIDTFPLLRKLADLAPDGQIPFTDVQLGPYKTYETGYARTIPGTNIKVEKPMGRLGALLNLFNVPLRPAKTEQQIIEEQIQAIKDVESFRKQKAKLEALRD